MDLFYGFPLKLISVLLCDSAMFTPFGSLGFVTRSFLEEDSLKLWTLQNVATSGEAAPVQRLFSGAKVVRGFDWRFCARRKHTQLVSYSSDGSVRLWSVDDRMIQKCSVMNPGLGDHLHASTGSNPWMGLTETRIKSDGRTSSKLMQLPNSPHLDDSLGLLRLFEGLFCFRLVYLAKS